MDNRQLEKDLEKSGTEYLSWDGWRSLKTDPVSNRAWGKGFGEKGMADHQYIRYRDYGDPGLSPLNASRAECELMWIEWKRLGGKAADHQRTWIERERRRGALVLLVGEDFEATHEAFVAWYRVSGLMVKDIR